MIQQTAAADSVTGPGRISQAQIQAKFEISIALAISTWQALTLAVQEQWGGPDSSEKRDWFAGAISDLFEQSAESIDREYLEEFMLQVMNDEFEVNVEDGSGEPVAELIMQLRRETLLGDFSRVDEMLNVWNQKRNSGSREQIKIVRAQDQEEDTDWDEEEDRGEEDDDDAAMDVDEAPKPVKNKPIPKIDEDGFTKVVGRRGR